VNGSNERSFPQPYEGVSGSARTDDLLSLDVGATPRRMLMAGMADCMYHAVLVGNPAPVVARMGKRIRDPHPGDIVLVTDSLYRRDEDTRIKGFGILLAHRTEWWQTDAELAADIARMRADGDVSEEYLTALESGEERPTDHAWYVQYGPESTDICRWTNCHVIAILADHREVSKPVGTRDGNGVTFTRDGILGGLADSGFELRVPGA
jgi:hypothetical protein